MGSVANEASQLVSEHTSKDAVTTLRYLQWLDLYLTEKPYQIFCPLNDPTVPRSNLQFEERIGQIIHDARGIESEFNLDEHGFAYVNFEIDLSFFKDQSSIETRYMPEVKSLVFQQLQDVKKVYIFDWQIRRTWTNDSGIIDGKDKAQHLLPSSHVHLDQDHTIVPRMVRHHLPNEADDLLARRVRIVNVWKPLVDVVYNHALALCDGSTIAKSDLVAADHITQRHFDVNCFALHNPRHRWWYLNRQRLHEAVIFKNFDSDQTVKARCCLHTSFVQDLPGTEHEPSRESIEVRLLVFS